MRPKIWTITNSDDIQAINGLSQDYMGGELKTFIRRLERRGEAVLVDDEQEKVTMTQVRPRKSRHGGRRGERLGKAQKVSDPINQLPVAIEITSNHY